MFENGLTSFRNIYSIVVQALELVENHHRP